MSDTHDNGREEQWVVCDVPLGPNCGLCRCKLDASHVGEHENWHGSKWGTPMGPRKATYAELEAELEAARAQAGLAQELVDEMRLHPWDFKAKYGRGVDHVGLMSRWDSLPAGPTAELCNAGPAKQQGPTAEETK